MIKKIICCLFIFSLNIRAMDSEGSTVPTQQDWGQPIPNIDLKPEENLYESPPLIQEDEIEKYKENPNFDKEKGRWIKRKGE